MANPESVAVRVKLKYINACKFWEEFKSWKNSKLKEEKVVNEPSKPVTSMLRNIELSLIMLRIVPEQIPNIKHPKPFINIKA